MIQRDDDGDLSLRTESKTRLIVSRTDAMYPEGGVRLFLLGNDGWTCGLYLTDAEARAVADAIQEKVTA